MGRLGGEIGIEDGGLKIYGHLVRILVGASRLLPQGEILVLQFRFFG